MTQDIGELWLDRAAQYAIDVRSGVQPACKYVQLAVQRWFEDLEHGHERGLYFDENAAARQFRFIHRHCRHYIGEFAGKPIEFGPWQCFIEANVHGWKREDGTRRFRIVYEEVARKNGKSTRLAADGDYYLLADDEPGAQVYIAATKKEQTKEIFEAASAIIDSDSALSKMASTYRNEIRYKHNVMLRLSKDSKKMDGFNVHAGLVDELHAHPNSSIWDVLRSAMGARKQPLLRGITTAGFDRNSFAYELRSMIVKILEKTVQKDNIFGIIYTIDDPEKWDSESEWAKANPNLGVSVSLQDLREQCEEAKEMPSAKVEFLTKRLNHWTYGAVAWMPMDKWHACKNSKFDAVEPLSKIYSGDLLGCEAYGGVDLSSVEDLTSFTLVFPFGDKRITVTRSYLPQAALERRLKKGDKTFESYKELGHLIVTDGDTVDYEFIKADVLLACERFDVRGIAFDRWNSNHLVNQLIELEIPMIQFGQGFASMSAPMKELLRLTLNKDIEHNDALLTWAVSNVVAANNPAGDIKPDKSQVSEKIDPAVALIMAIALAIKPEEDDGSSQGFVDLNV